MVSTWSTHASEYSNLNRRDYGNFLPSICNDQHAPILCGGDHPTEAMGMSLKPEPMYHEVNDKGTKSHLWTALAETAKLVEPVQWDDLSIDDLTIEIMKFALTHERLYNSMSITFGQHQRPWALSPLERRIRQIFLNLAKGNTDET